MEWVTQIGDSKWLDSALVSSPLSHKMLMMEQRKEIHLDFFIKATDFLGAIYRAYEDPINVNPNNRLEHMTN